MRDFTKFHAEDFTGVKRVAIEPTLKPFAAQVLEGPGWRVIGSAATRAGAEALARQHRTDHRGATLRIKERRREGGYAYIAM